MMIASIYYFNKTLQAHENRSIASVASTRGMANFRRFLGISKKKKCHVTSSRKTRNSNQTLKLNFRFGKNHDTRRSNHGALPYFVLVSC